MKPRPASCISALLLSTFCSAAIASAPQSTADLESARRIVREAEAQRVDVFDRCARATVCIFADPSRSGGGSGVIFRPDGYGLTNFHVVQEFIESRRGLGGLSDGNLYPLEVLGIDPGGDIALFRLSGKDSFDFAPLGDSDALHVGESVAAMGNPFLVAEDLRPTITSGIISGLHRYQEGQGNLLEYADCIQVSTSINPGNSGGPLFSSRGEIIGINGRASFEERGRVNVGLGYAVTINQIRRFIPGLRAGRLMEHGTLGATAQTIGDELVISAMQDFSPAERAGIRLGDKLLAVNGRPMHTANDFNNAVAILPAGWSTDLRFEHGGRIVEARTRLERVALPPSLRFAFDLERNQMEAAAILERARKTRCPVAVPADAARAVMSLSFAFPRLTEAPTGAIGGEQKRSDGFFGFPASQPMHPEALRLVSEFSAIIWPAWASPALDEKWQLVGADDFLGRVVAVIERRSAENRSTQWLFDPVTDQIVGAAFMDGDEATSRWRAETPGCWVGEWSRVWPDADAARVRIERIEYLAPEDRATTQPVRATESQPSTPPAASQPTGQSPSPPSSAFRKEKRQPLIHSQLNALTAFAQLQGPQEPTVARAADASQTAPASTPAPMSPAPHASAAKSTASDFAAAIASAHAGVVKIYAAGIGTVKGYASGVIVGAHGHIVTVSSAILEDPSLRVVLNDGRRFPATVVRRDETRRLAELKIDADGLPALEFADTSRLSPGDWLISASNTFKVAEGPEPVSVSLGVFSARGELAARRRAQDFPYDGEVIYTDLIVATPGSAGGALVNAAGQLVGVIGPLVKSTRTNTFANYALPAEEVAAFLAGKSQDTGDVAGSVTKGVDLLALGVRLLDLGGRERPAFIERVRPGSAAYRAGLLPDDLLMSISGNPVATCDDVAAVLATLKRTPTIEIIVKRGDELKTVELALEGRQ